MTTRQKIDQLLTSLRKTEGELPSFAIHDYQLPRFAVAEVTSWPGDEAAFRRSLLNALAVCRTERKQIKYRGVPAHHLAPYARHGLTPYYEVVVFFEEKKQATVARPTQSEWAAPRWPV